MQTKLELIHKQAIPIPNREIYILKQLMSNCKFHNDGISPSAALVNFSTDNKGRLVVKNDAETVNGLVYKVSANKSYGTQYDKLCLFKRHNTVYKDWGFFLYNTKTKETSEDFYVDDTLYNIPIKLKKLLYSWIYGRLCADSMQRYKELNKWLRQTN